MVAVYLISALIVTTNTIPTGWIQYTHPYTDKDSCMSVIEATYSDIEYRISIHVGKSFVQFIEMTCMTQKDAIRRNSELGH